MLNSVDPNQTALSAQTFMSQHLKFLQINAEILKDMTAKITRCDCCFGALRATHESCHLIRSVIWLPVCNSAMRWNFLYQKIPEIYM